MLLWDLSFDLFTVWKLLIYYSFIC